MPDPSRNYLAVDIGGTHVKSALVSASGMVDGHQKVHTKDWRSEGDIPLQLARLIRHRLQQHPEAAKEIGIGIPGLVSRDRSTVLEVPAIPELNGVALKAYLSDAFPDRVFFLENDANAAAIGEHYFILKDPETSCIFVTLGTGVGGAAIIRGEYFSGGNGNPVELGHMLSRGMFRLEQIIGKLGILKLATESIQRTDTNSPYRLPLPVGIPDLIEAAYQDNILIKDVFYECGLILGETLVNLIRALDITHILIGGGISVAFEFIQPGIQASFNKYLTPYYLKQILVEKATLGNDAGLLGAIVPCIKHA